jgi:hypothetical protein
MNEKILSGRYVYLVKTKTIMKRSPALDFSQNIPPF